MCRSMKPPRPPWSSEVRLKHCMAVGGGQQKVKKKKKVFEVCRQLDECQGPRASPTSSYGKAGPWVWLSTGRAFTSLSIRETLANYLKQRNTPLVYTASLLVTVARGRTHYQPESPPNLTPASVEALEAKEPVFSAGHL